MHRRLAHPSDRTGARLGDGGIGYVRSISDPGGDPWQTKAIRTRSARTSPRSRLAPPDTGQGEDVESEVPEGVESLSQEQKQAAEERGGGDEGDDGGALDVSEVMGEGGDDAEASAADDAGDDAGDDDAGDDAEAQRRG